MTPEAGMSLDPVDWADLRRTGHAMLDDMFDPPAGPARARRCLATAVPSGARRVRRRSPAGAYRAGGGARAVPARHPALRRRQRASRLHGLGAGRRHGGGHAGRDAGRGRQRQLGRPRPYGHRGRAPDRPLVRRAVRPAARRERPVRDRRLDGQLHGRADRAHLRPGRGLPHGGRGREPACAHRLRGARRSRLHRAGAGHGGPGLRRPAPDRRGRGPPHAASGPGRRGRRRPRRRAPALPAGRHGGERGRGGHRRPVRPGRLRGGADAVVPRRWGAGGAGGPVAHAGAPAGGPGARGQRRPGLPQVGPGSLRRRLPALPPPARAPPGLRPGRRLSGAGARPCRGASTGPATTGPTFRAASAR